MPHNLTKLEKYEILYNNNFINFDDGNGRNAL